jgi:outer membrane immunogenic protein
MFKRLLTAALLVTAAGTAHAADLGKRIVKPQPYAPLPMFSWTGFHLGVHAGYSFAHDRDARTIGTSNFLGLANAGLVPTTLSAGRDGFTGGVQAGYSVDFGGFVAGFEADVSAIDNKKTSRFASPGAVALALPGGGTLSTGLTTSASSELQWLGTARARLGVAFDRFHVYATGGLAFGDVETTARVDTAAAAAFWSGSRNDTRVGYALGAGAEYAITNTIVLRGEYLYYDLGSQSTSALGNATIDALRPGNAALRGVDYITRTNVNGSVIRAGVNAKF